MYLSLAYRHSLQTTTANETACWKELEKPQQNLAVQKKRKSSLSSDTADSEKRKGGRLRHTGRAVERWGL